MRILIATGIYPPDIGGPATYSKLLADELPKKGIEVKVLSFGSVRHLPKVIRHLLYFFRALKTAKNCDIIYAQDPVSVGLPAILASKILNKRFLLKVVGDYAWEQYQQSGFSGHSLPSDIEEFQNKKFGWITELRRRVERWVAKNASAIIVPSRYLKKIVLMWGIQPEKVEVIYNSFEEPIYALSKEEARKRLGIGGRIIVSAGRLVPWKGFLDLIETMPELLKKFPDLMLIIAGSGPDWRLLKDKTCSLGVEKNVILAGKLSREDLLAHISAADVFVLNTGYEGFSHQILEAMALGVPVAVSRAGGNGEIIENDSQGILFDYRDKKEIESAITRLLGDKKLAEKIGEFARLRASAFNKDKMISELIDTLKK